MRLEKTLWQIGTGDDKRPYNDVMVTQGVALLGSGTDGEWYEGHPEYPAKGPIRTFAQSANSGDLIVARRGLHRALALGVIGEYDHSEAFDDVQGWDQHYRRVRWLHHVEEHRFDRPVFRQGRFSRCHKPEVYEWAARLIAGSGDDLHAPVEGDDLRELPAPEPTVGPESFGEPVAEILRAASRWKEKTWDGSLGARPSEDELLTHITVPLLEALGWDPEQIAVKWRFTDLALFDPVRREPANCQCVIEGKRIGDGLLFASWQAREYIRDLELRDADLLVTDGIRYLLHQAPDFVQEEALEANLALPKARRSFCSRGSADVSDPARRVGSV